MERLEYSHFQMVNNILQMDLFEEEEERKEKEKEELKRDNCFLKKANKYIAHLHRILFLLTLALPRSLDEVQMAVESDILEDYIYRPQGKVRDISKSYSSQFEFTLAWLTFSIFNVYFI